MNMKQASDTRERILEKASELLTQRGFNGFSYRDISTHLGVKNAAIHYHFPSKTDLAVALVGEFQQTLDEQTGAFMRNGGPALPQLEGLFWFTDKQMRMGRIICPIGAFSVDYDELPEEVRAATDKFLSDSTRWLTRVLETGRQQNEFGFAGEPADKATEILATLQGARQMARIHGMDVMQRVMDQIRTGLGLPT